MKHRLIGQVMTRDVIKAGYGTAFKRIAESLGRYGISGLPVVDDDGQVLGVVSETDLMLHQSARSDAHRPWYARAHVTRSGRAAREKARARTAGQLMSTPAVTVGPHETVVAAARLMAARRVERLPVVDDGGHLVGIVTRGGLLSVFRRPDAEIRGEVIEEVLVRTLWLAPRAIGVDVHQGVVVLSGTVQRRSEAALAVRLAGRVDGVVSVVDQLGYQEDDSHLRPSEQALRGITEEWIRKL